MSRVTYENPDGAAPAQGLYSHAARVTAGALYFVDQQATGALKEKTREEIENPMLGGGIKSYLDIDGDEEDDVPEAAPAPLAEAAAEAAAPPSEQ